MISLIICSIDPGRFRSVCESYARALAPELYEVIGIHDAKSLAEGYNRGVARSRGDLVIFSHDDVEVLNPDFRARLMGHMAHADLVGVAGATRVTGGAWAFACPPFAVGQIAHHKPEMGMYYAAVWGAPARRVEGIKIMDGLFLCARRAVVEAVSFDAEIFNGFHVYDADFTFRAHRAGFRLSVGCDLCLLHRSLGEYDEQWNRYEELFRLKHRGRLDVMTRRKFNCGYVACERREDLLEIMTPPWWGP